MEGRLASEERHKLERAGCKNHSQNLSRIVNNLSKAV